MQLGFDNLEKETFVIHSNAAQVHKVARTHK